MRMTLIDDTRYDEEMDETVLPALAACCEEGWMEPADRPGLPKLSNPGKLHYMCYDVHRFVGPQTDRESDDRGERGVQDGYELQGSRSQQNDQHINDHRINDQNTSDSREPQANDNDVRPFRGAIVLSHGFTEFATKYSEMIWYFLRAGYSVCALEHRGHGYSPRDVDDPNVIWIDDWRRYVVDLATFASTVGRQYACGGPLYLYAHSMGGGVGAAVLEQYPSLFDKAVLSSPMIAPITAGIPNDVAGAAATAMCAWGMGKKPAIGQSAFSQELDISQYPGACEQRVRWYHKQRCLHPEYQANMASYGWVREAVRLSHAVQRPESCANVRVPILLCQSGRDEWVRNGPQEVFAKRVRDGGASVTIERFSESLHEIFSMPNDTVSRYLNCILDFVK